MATSVETMGKDTLGDPFADAIASLTMTAHRNAERGRIVLSRIHAWMPLIVGQAYALWLLASGRSAYFQIMLMSAAGAFLATVIGTFIGLNSLRSLIKQIRGLLGCSGAWHFCSHSC